MYKPMSSMRLLVTILMVLSAAAYGASALARRGQQGWGSSLLLEGLRRQQLNDDGRNVRRFLEEEHAVIDLLLRGRLSKTSR